MIYPLGAGVMSAWASSSRRSRSTSSGRSPAPLDALDWDAVARAVAEMEAEGRAVLGRTIPADAGRASAGSPTCATGAGLRDPRADPDGPLDAARRDEVRAAFEAAYRALYGRTVRDAPIEAVSWRVVAQGPGRRSGSRPAPARAGTRGPR